MIHRCLNRKRLVCFVWILLGVASQSQTAAADELDAGLMFDQFSLTLDEGRRTEVLGPLFYDQTKDSEHTFAVPPLFSHVSDPITESEEFDFVYPLLTYDRYGHEYRWQLLQLLSFSGGQNQADVPAHRFTLFPFYFQQSSPDPALNYTALFPVYGHLNNRLFKDEISFALFPLYAQTRKRDVVTDNYVFPVFHLRHGDGLHGWQFWPLVGHEHKDVTIKTNRFGDAETVGGHDKLFALWPVFAKETTGVGTENPQRLFSVLPAFSYSRSPNRDSTSVLWPFFNWIDEREKKYREWEVPWPFVVIARGEGKTTTRVWPIFSRAHNATTESDFYLWPLYKYNRVHSDPLDRERTRILFFLLSDLSEKNTQTGAARKRFDLWPLFTHRQDFNGNARLQVFAPIEPMLPNSKSVERNWSPVWSIWRTEKNPKTGCASESFLWNLYRREKTPASKKCSLLFGLFQYQSDAKAKRLRLFYIPLTKTQKDSGHVSEHR